MQKILQKGFPMGSPSYANCRVIEDWVCGTPVYIYLFFYHSFHENIKLLYKEYASLVLLTCPTWNLKLWYILKILDRNILSILWYMPNNSSLLPKCDEIFIKLEFCGLYGVTHVFLRTFTEVMIAWIFPIQNSMYFFTRYNTTLTCCVGHGNLATGYDEPPRQYRARL